jgi:3-isopropylmalate/(R)-2-methylmalate dehydratase small subunit
MKSFGGKVLFLNRSDINTDEIIPAKYLTEISKEALKPYLLEDLELEGFDPARDIEGKKVIVSRENFGCGSSREHAPWALEVNDINMVVAQSYARIFRQNMFNCGMLALELEKEKIDYLFDRYSGKECEISIELDRREIGISSEKRRDRFPISIRKFDETLVKAGGWVEYADKQY